MWLSIFRNILWIMILWLFWRVGSLLFWFPSLIIYGKGIWVGHCYLHLHIPNYTYFYSYQLTVLTLSSNVAHKSWIYFDIIVMIFRYVSFKGLQQWLIYRNDQLLQCQVYWCQPTRMEECCWCHLLSGAFQISKCITYILATNTLSRWLRICESTLLCL